MFGDGMVSFGSDGHLVTSSLVTEANCKSRSRRTGAKTLSSTVRDLVIAVKTQKGVVTTGAVVPTWVFARVQTATSCVVSRRVLDTGRKSQILFISQTSITSGLAVHVSMFRHVHRLRATVMTLRQNGKKLGMNQTRKNNRGTRVPQLRGALGYRLQIMIIDWSNYCLLNIKYQS